MKDSFDEDPFAEYDKYWDDLDRLEEKNKKREEYQSHPEKHHDDKPREIDRKNMWKIIFVIGIFIAFYSTATDGPGFFMIRMISTPLMMLIIISIIISAINKKNIR